MGNVLGLIFANMHEENLPELTKARAMASVPFGARYRLVDFPLSSMVNSGISQVGIITQAKYYSLMDHLGMGSEWDLARKTGGLHILPPYGRSDNGVYRGRLEALAGAAEFIHESGAEYVIMSDSNVVANIDFKPIIEFHEKKGADITCVYGKGVYDADRTSRFTVLGVDDNDVVYDVLSRPSISGEVKPTLNIYVTRRDFLENIIRESECRSLYSFETDILQHKLHDFKIFGYKYDGYFACISSFADYYAHSMELLSDASARDALFNVKDRPIYTKVRNSVPAFYAASSSVRNSMVADGCEIEGSVENSILFRGVKIGKNATVKNSIIMQDTVIGTGVQLDCVITDKNVVIRIQPFFNNRKNIIRINC